MEVKINREIREYKENIFFGLSLRQFFFSICACIVSLLLYFIFKPYFNIEILSWICILGSMPFALLGFVRYNGMPAEKFILAWIKSVILTPRKLVFKPNNLYYKTLKEVEVDNNNTLKNKERKGKKERKK